MLLIPPCITLSNRHSYISWSLLKLMFMKSVMPSNHLILCCPLLLPSSFPSIRVFSNTLTLHIRWPKYWSFSFSICPSSDYSGLISFRIDRFDLLAVQGIYKSLPQYHNSKASILWHSAFSTVQLSRPTGKKSTWPLEKAQLWPYGHTHWFFPVSWPFALNGWRVGASALAIILPMNM